MSIEKKFARGAVFAVVCGLAMIAVSVGQLSAQERAKKVRAERAVKVAQQLPACNNADFYTPDGKFNEEAAKKAYLDLMQYYNYPVNETTRKNLFVSDMGLGKFTEVGLGVVIMINEPVGN